MPVASVRHLNRSPVKKNNQLNVHVNARQATASFSIDGFHPKRFKTSLSLLKRNRILLKFTVLKQLFRSVYLKDCQDFLKKKRSYLFLVICYFLWKRKKI